MKFLGKIILASIFLLPISNSFGAMTFSQKAEFADQPSGAGIVAGIEFNKDGTKIFISYANKSGVHTINEYNLTIPYDVSSKVYAGDSERCVLTGTDGNTIYDLEISSDGMKLFVVSRRVKNNDQDGDKVYGYDLSSPYDISTCSLASETENLDNGVFTVGSNAGDFAYPEAMNNLDKHRLQGVEINNDGTKLFLIFMDTESDTVNGRLYEFNLTTPYDVSTLSIVTSAGIALGTATQTGVNNPAGMRFSPNGKRLIITSHHHLGIQRVMQISLSKGFDTSSFTIDGSRILGGSGLEMSETNTQTRGAAFSGSGLKVYIGSDRSQNNDEVYEYDLVCPFDIIGGNCPSITENSDRTGMALAQIEIAKRTIDHSTDTALNRLKWIRRNKDKQNLTNLNLNINFTNQKLASLTEVIRTSAAKNKSKNEDKEEDLFYWREGSIAVGRIGDTSISSTKKIGTDAITFGVDKFVKNNEIKGLAFRVGRNNVDVGSAGSNLDTDTYNITYYATSPIKDDTKFVDTIVGFGKIRSKYLTIANKINHTANRTGQQIYFTRKIKDEIKKNNFTIIPSGQFDFGQTILNGYSETGLTGITFEKQHVRTRNLRGAIAIVEDLSNEDISFKRHGKLEYSADLSRSSNLEYRYNSGSDTIHTTLHSGSIHNLKGEIGIDIVLPNNFSVFFIYERNQALDVGHTDKVHIAIGYLPNKETNYAFSIDGSDEFKSNYVLSKNINDYLIDFKLTNDLMSPKDYDEASFNLIRKF